MNKTRQHEAIRERAREAIRELYHNATPRYPRLEGREAEAFEAWFSSAARDEIEYMQDGSAYGENYRDTLAHPANAGKFKSERARAYYITAGMRKMRLERADCGTLTGWRVLELAAGNEKLRRQLLGKLTGGKNNALWERVSVYGKLYQYGRGGRTLAPEKLVSTRGGSSFSLIEDFADKHSIAACMEFIRRIESFNRYVAQWCVGVPEMWADHWREQQREERRERLEARIRAEVSRAFT